MAEPQGPLRSPGFWLHHAALAWRQQLDAGLRELGLTHTQFNVLASAGWLTRQAGPPTQQQVARMAGADRMMTSRVLATLAERGLVTRHADPEDTRANRVTVTAAGAGLVSRAVRVVADIDEQMFGPAGRGRDELRERLRLIAGQDPVTGYVQPPARRARAGPVPGARPRLLT